MQAEIGIGDQAALVDVVHRLNFRLPVDADQLVVPTALDEFITQKSISAKFSPVAARQLKEDSDPVHKIRLNTYSAPGCNRWLESTPSQTLDKHLTSCEVFTTISLQLGVDVYDGETLCKFCGSISDRAGIHALSCTAGGDILHRHNEIRDLIHSFCIRARLNPELEKAGLLEDENVMVDLRRPADVLVDNPSNRGRNSRVWSKTALDVKVINGLGQSHLEASRGDGLAAAEIYRQEQIEHLRTGELCAAQDISYQPLVFTARGGCERHAEALISQIAKSIAQSARILH